MGKRHPRTLKQQSLTAVIVMRTYLEDETLYEELKGYDDHAKDVKYRLIPEIW